MKKLLIIFIQLYLFLSVHCFGQDSECVKKIYVFEGAIYNNCENIALSSLSEKISCNDVDIILNIRDLFANEDVLNSFLVLRDDSINIAFAKRFLYSETYKGYSVDEFDVFTGNHDPFLNHPDRSQYFEAILKLNVFLDSIISKSHLVNVSFFYFNKNLDGEIYFFERGMKYDDIFEVRFDFIFNQSFLSPIFPYSVSQEQEYLIGICKMDHIESLIIPIIRENEVLFNIRILKCS